LFENIGIEQHPDYLPIVYAVHKICYFICTDENDILAYTPILEKNHAAFIYFGPLIHKTDNTFIKEIADYYKKKSFAFIELIPSLINKEDNLLFKDKERIIQNGHKWATIRIDLTEDINTISNKFSEHHKRQLKKSLQEKLYVTELNDINQIENFADIYINMYHYRKIKTYLYDVKEVFKNLFLWIQKDNGFVIGVFKEDILIGGLYVLFAGNTAYFQFGASDAEYRNLPILHSAFFKAFELAKSLNKKCFDMGGYVTDATEKEQVFNINRFKRGFSENIIIFPDTLRIKLNSAGYWLYQLEKKIYSWYRKIF